MVIDIHSHILPGIDDGSKNMEETKKMLVIAAREGIRGIVATPHYEAGLDEEWLAKYREAYLQVLTLIQQKKLPIQLYPGNEIYYSDSMIEALGNGSIHTMNGTKYVLVEFPTYADYGYIERALRSLQNAGYWPIIAHVERYRALRDVKRVEALVDMGVYIQVNTSSVMGKTGWSIKMFCLKLMKKGLVHVIGTDAHGWEHRRPRVKLCFDYLDKKVGKSYRRLISEKNPEKIIKGERIRGKD